jgi:hypothetical protein
VPDQGEQGGVLEPSHNAFVNGAGLLGVQHLAGQRMLTLEQGEVAEDRLAGKRIQIGALDHHRAVVPEPFQNLKARHPAIHGRSDPGFDPDQGGRHSKVRRSAITVHPSLGGQRRERGSEQEQGQRRARHHNLPVSGSAGRCGYEALLHKAK